MKKHSTTNEILSELDIRRLHPNICFGTNTYYELGFEDYTPPVPEPTADQIISIIKLEVQNHLDTKAKEYGYDNIFSAVGYVGDPDPVFNNEAIALRNWRSSVWRYCYGVLADVQNSLRAAPTAQELIAELPAYTPPV